MPIHPQFHVLYLFPDETHLKLKHTDIFHPVRGTQSSDSDEKFIIIFASGQQHSSHFDLVRTLEKRIFTLQELPEAAQTYWKLSKVSLPTNVHVHIPSTTCIPQSQSRGRLGFDFQLKRILEFPPIHATISTNWKAAFSHLYQFSNRDSFLYSFRPDLVSRFFRIMELSIKNNKDLCNEIDVTHTYDAHEMLYACWGYFELLTTEEQVKLQPRRTDPLLQEETATRILDFFTGNLQRVLICLRYFIQAVATNVTLEVVDREVSLNNVLRCLRFLSSELAIFKFEQALVTLPSQLASKVSERQQQCYKEAMKGTLGRWRRVRNFRAHPATYVRAKTTRPICLDADVLLALAIINVWVNQFNAEDHFSWSHHDGWFK